MLFNVVPVRVLLIIKVVYLMIGIPSLTGRQIFLFYFVFLPSTALDW